MTAAGWFFLCLSWGAINGLTAYCFYRVLKKQK